MKNQEVAKLLYEIADLLELKDELIYKIRAYRRAAQAIETLSAPIEEIPAERLDDIPGVGKGIAEKITEFLQTGKSEYYEKLKKKMPMDFEALMAIEGIGPKKVKLLYDKLKIKNVKQLEESARKGKIRKIPTLGAKTEENILKAVQFSKISGQRMLLGIVLPVAEELVAELRELPYVKHANYAGSLRRMKETIGDIDILVTSPKAEKVVDYFVKMKDVIGVIARGPTKASVRMKAGLQVDLRVLPESRYGAALLYFTGSKEHNIELRKIAIAKRMKLSEYGLFKGNKIAAGRTEEEVYKVLGLDYIEPEMREARGEIAAAKQHKLPKLVRNDDILGDLHMHTKWSDGTGAVEEMASAARRKGYEYICITDHLGELKIAGALAEKDIDKQAKEIEKAKKRTGIKILHGAEIDIRANGSFDISNESLKKLDIVIAALHSALKGTKEKNTSRILAAMDNPHVDIIAHPTGRLISKREGADIDMQKIIKKSLDTHTILEIDSQPTRLDLSDVNAKAAIEAGCKLAINSDAHSADQLRLMRLGIAVARRAWCEKKDVVNVQPYAKFAKAFEING